MKVLLCPALNAVAGKIEHYVPYGLLALKAAVATYDHVDVALYSPSESLLHEKFATSDDLAEAVLSDIEKLQFEVIGFSFVCNSAHYSISIAKRLKARNPSLRILAGGPYVTKLSTQILQAFPFIDAVFVGEADYSFAKYVSNLGRRKNALLALPGVHTREWALVSAPPIDDLDCLEPVALVTDYFTELAKTRRHVSRAIPAPLEASRGCPLKCSFCSTRQVWGASVRRMSPCRLLRDMKVVHEATHDTFFSLIGDNLGVPRNKFLSFCRSFAEINDNFTWGCSLKLDRFAPDHLKVLWDAGCRSMFIGVESSSQETLDKVNKAARVDNEVSGIFCAIEMGFKVETSFIIGFPWETESEIRSTYDLHCSLLKAGAARSQVGILCPIPGTDIVKDGDILFDGLTSYVTTQDEVCLSIEHGVLVDEHPLLFSHFGRYDTPNIRRPVLKAYAEAATRVAQLHLRQRRIDAEMNASNHGRSAT